MLRRGDELEWGIGEADHLAQVIELIEQAKPRVEVDQRLEPRKRAHHDMAGDEGSQAVEIRLRHEVIEDVDDHGREPHGWASRAPCLGLSQEDSGFTFCLSSVPASLVEGGDSCPRPTECKMRLKEDRQLYDRLQSHVLQEMTEAVRGHLRLLLSGRVPPDLNA